MLDKEWVSDLLPPQQCFSGENKLIFNDMKMMYALDQTNKLGWILFFYASSLKQQSVDRYVAPLGHIILILSQPVFAFSP